MAKKIELLSNQFEPTLRLVLCEWGGQFVTWMDNLEIPGYFEGHYYNTLEDAVESFINRLSKLERRICFGSEYFAMKQKYYNEAFEALKKVGEEV